MSSKKRKIRTSKYWWYWEEDDVLRPYDELENTLLESGYEADEEIVSFRHYDVNLHRMTQQNTLTRYIRKVYRKEEIFCIEPLNPEPVTVNFKLAESDSELCVICLNAMAKGEAVLLNKCSNHFFHKTCILSWFDVSCKCPTCGIFYKKNFGDMPDGTMKVSKINEWIEIDYDFPDGKDSYGKDYGGTRRIAYLENNTDGLIVLDLLKRAFEQRLTFTIGTSITTGKYSVIWNGIHHKTSKNGGMYGFPDASYYDRVKDELKSKNITA